APHRRPVQEEALLAREAVLLRVFLAFRGGLHGVEGDREPAEVGDVLPERQLAVHLAARVRLVAVELRREATGARLELRRVGLLPPDLEVARRAEAAALVIVA